MTKNNKIWGALIVVIALGGGCTTTKTNIQSLNISSNNMSEICITENKDVIVKDFLPVLQAGFARHNINTKIYDQRLSRSCEYQLTYDAHGRWDLYVYLASAYIEIRHNNEIVAYANYRGPSGLNPAKRESTQSKIDPVIDELLKEFPRK